MNALVTHVTPLLAQDAPRTLRAVRWDVPETFEGWLAMVAVCGILLAWIVWLYVRDTRGLPSAATAWLLLLRVAVLAGVAVIFLNPHERTTSMGFKPSRVAILVDTSLSMELPADAPKADASGGSERSRIDAVRRLLADSPLIETLREQHEISLYRFDSSFEGPLHTFHPRDERARLAETTPVSEGTVDSERAVERADWDDWLRLGGTDTRLGESVLEAVTRLNGNTLAGLVVISDGVSNAGVEPPSARDAALAARPRVRIVTLGVGSTQKQSNLRIANLQGPTDVHVGDAFDLSAFVQGQRLAGERATVELRVQPDGDPQADPQVVETREIALHEDDVPVEVKFEIQPSEPGEFRYTVRTDLLADIREALEDDNEGDHTVRVVDRKTRVLLVAGGPMRDYQFLRNALFRHPAIEVDVWLQSIEPRSAPSISQDADAILFQFPEEPSELFQYDVIVAFDPDWKQVPSHGIRMLVDWVSDHAGGLVLVAGDVQTPALASASDEFQPILDLYPVFLNSYLLEFFDAESDQAWPVGFTREGQDAGFLQLSDNLSESRRLWEQFEGIYRCYPTAGAKAGAAVYARFTDTRAATEHGQPILFASQFYGAGRTFYLGSAEIWRLRSLSDEYYDRFWTRLIREVAQGRMRRGASRGMLLPERREYYLGQTVRIRARLLDSQFAPLVAESVPLEVYDPGGRPLVPARTLTQDRDRPGEFVGDFRASLPGRYRLELPIPESNESERMDIDVRLPDLEKSHPEQNVAALVDLSRDTGGRYLRLDEAESQLAALLPYSPEEFQVDERLRTLWDRDWLLFLIVGLLSVEWLTRKLLKLA